jgi:hypothetical protein
MIDQPFAHRIVHERLRLRYFLFYGVQVTVLAAAIPLLAVFKKLPTAFKWVLYYLAFSLLCDLSSQAIYHLSVAGDYSMMNVPGNGYTLLNPIIISLLYFYLGQNRMLKYLLIVFNIILFASSVTMISFERPAYSAFNILAESFLILTLSIYYYFRLLREMPSEKLQSLPSFWVVSGLFFSTAGKLIIFSVSNYMLEVMPQNMVLLVRVHNVLSIIGNLLIMNGAWKLFKLLRTNSGKTTTP